MLKHPLTSLNHVHFLTKTTRNEALENFLVYKKRPSVHSSTFGTIVKKLKYLCCYLSTGNISFQK